MPRCNKQQVFVSYCPLDTGSSEQGGDGTAGRLLNSLGAAGVSVFLQQQQQQQHEEPPRLTSQSDAWLGITTTTCPAIKDCYVFVALISSHYYSDATRSELRMARTYNKRIIPIWHSGSWPPSEATPFEQSILSDLELLPKCTSSSSNCIELQQQSRNALQRPLDGSNFDDTMSQLLSLILESPLELLSQSNSETWPSLVISPTGSSMGSTRTSPRLASSSGCGWESPPEGCSAKGWATLKETGLPLDKALFIVQEWGYAEPSDLKNISDADIDSLGLRKLEVLRVKGAVARAKSGIAGAAAPAAGGALTSMPVPLHNMRSGRRIAPRVSNSGWEPTPRRQQASISRQSSLSTLAATGSLPAVAEHEGPLANLVELLAPGNPESAREEAADTLRRLSAKSENWGPIVAAGAILPLVEMLDGSNPVGARVVAARALKNLAADPGNQERIPAAGAVPLLVDMLGEGNPDLARDHAARALWNLAWSPANQERIAAAAGIPALIQLLAPGNPVSAREQAAGALWNLACEPRNKVAIVAAGAVPWLVELLGAQHPASAREQAAGALCILAIDDGNERAIVAAGAVSPLVALLGPGNPMSAREQAAWALKNLACSEEHKVAVAAAGAIPHLVALLARDLPVSVREQAAGVLCNLAVHYDSGVSICAEGAVVLLLELLAPQQPLSAREQAAWALKNLAANENPGVKAEMACAIPSLVQLIKPGNPDTIREQAAAVLCNLAWDEKEHQELREEEGAEGAGEPPVILGTPPRPPPVAPRGRVGPAGGRRLVPVVVPPAAAAGASSRGNSDSGTRESTDGAVPAISVSAALQG